MLLVNVVTLFPEVFEVPLATSIMGRAARSGLVRYRIVNLREFATDRRGTVDDYPYGGGPGMVMQAAPFADALASLGAKEPIVLLSARGTPFRHDDAVRLSLADELTLLCGHYKDVDHRVAALDGVEEYSVGEFVLSGGETAAFCVLDAVVRLLPGALGDHDSAAGDSFYEGLLSPPSYTRPSEYRGMRVPEVLLGGDHRAIARWRREQAERLTRERRPDLWERYLREHQSDATE